jgi:serine protease Do
MAARASRDCGAFRTNHAPPRLPRPPRRPMIGAVAGPVGMAVFWKRLVLALALGAGLAASAAAETTSIEDAEHATLRVAVISEGPEGRALYGTGSGFVVAPGLVITNAHVVADARREPTLAVAVVPAEGDGMIAARIIKFSALMDLALLEYHGGPDIKPVLISMREPRAGDAIIALGYPDIDDLQRPAIELVRPTPPSRTTGTIASLRDRAPTGDPIPSINHEAAIFSGSSGGPLIDECGRVIGVNTWHAREAETGEDRAVASRTSQLAVFLDEAGVKPRLTDERCLSVAERVEAERQATVAALETQNRELVSKLNDAERLTNIAVFILIGGTIALLASIGILGAILIARRPAPPAPRSMLDLDAAAPTSAYSPAPPPAAPAAAAPEAAPAPEHKGGASVAVVVAASAIAAFVVTAVAVWFLSTQGAKQSNATLENFSGDISCAYDGAASTKPSGDDASFSVSGQLCVNGRTLYAPAPDGVAFQRAILSSEAKAVDVLTLNPRTGEFRRERFALSDGAYEAAAQAAGAAEDLQSCDGAAARDALARRTETLMRFAEGRARERLVWRCEMKSAADH